MLRRLRRIQKKKDTAVCVGLDPDPERMPAPLQDRSPLDATMVFCRQIVDATAEAACAFKFNFAFFEALGPTGWQILAETARLVPDDCLTIADAKRGDIGNSARFYARAIFDDMGFDACTVAPYMGRDAVEPFLARAGTGAFVLARTSNDGAADLQEACTCADGNGDADVRDADGGDADGGDADGGDGTGGEPLYLHTARKVAEWSDGAPATGGLVAGATAPSALAELREACPELPFLVPGVGAQGGDPAAVMRAAHTPRAPVLVNSSRSILYASDGEDYADAAGQAARELREALGSPRS
jgi:orotidine-5'-phosphate decarboxylase